MFLGQNPNDARIRINPPRGVAQDGPERGLRNLLQGSGSSLGQTDSLHHDEVRLFREDAGIAVQGMLKT